MDEHLITDVISKTVRALHTQLTSNKAKLVDEIATTIDRQKKKTGYVIDCRIRLVPKGDCMEVRIKTKSPYVKYANTSAMADPTPTLAGF